MATAISTLKSYLKNRKKPTEQAFSELIDAFVHWDDDIKSLLGAVAEIQEAEEGIVNDKYMTPFLTRRSIEAVVRLSVLSDLATDVESKINEAVNALIDGAPDTLDTLNEIAEKLQDNDEGLRSLINLISEKANQNHTHTPDEVGLGNLPNRKSDYYNLDNSESLATSKALKELGLYITGLRSSSYTSSSTINLATSKAVNDLYHYLQDLKKNDINLDSAVSLATSKAVNDLRVLILNYRSSSIDSESIHHIANSKAVFEARKWENISGKPSTFEPSPHTHNWDSIIEKPAGITETRKIKDEDGKIETVTIEDGIITAWRGASNGGGNDDDGGGNDDFIDNGNSG